MSAQLNKSGEKRAQERSIARETKKPITRPTQTTPTTPTPSNTSLVARARHMWPAIALLGLCTVAANVLYNVPIEVAVVAAIAIAAVFVLVVPRNAASSRAEDAPTEPPKRLGHGIHSTIDAIIDPCLVADPRGKIQYVNEAARDRFGRIDIGDPVSFKLRVPAFLEALERVSIGGPQETIEWSEKVPTERFFQASLAPVRLPSSERIATGIGPDMVLVLVRDLTEQYRLERMRADFVANASHELRTPLASLTGFIETLQGPAKDDPSARERFLNVMLEQSNRMRRLIDDLLSLSRVEMKAHVRPTETVDLETVARHVVDSLNQLARDNSVKIQMSFPDHSSFVLGDHDELVQVVQNLIENAIKYGREGKQVEIAVERECDDTDCTLTMSVRDYGPGIAPEHLPRLTERFYRADVAASKQAQGTGLGLAIVKHILNRHDGILNVTSQLGHGATFTIRLREAKPGPDRSVLKASSFVD